MKSYPKLITLLLSFVFAYILFAMGIFHTLVTTLNGYGLVSAFLGGLLFSFGFTSAFGVGILIEVALDVSPWTAAFVGGIGALLSDLLIFELVRFSIFHQELHRLQESRFMRWIHRCLHHPSVSETVRKTLLWSFAGIVIASPLPDEFGVTLVSSVSTIRPRQFASLCFLLNTVGILLILLIARSA